MSIIFISICNTTVVFTGILKKRLRNWYLSKELIIDSPARYLYPLTLRALNDVIQMTILL